jgi:putative ABC transport system permease protein
METWREAKLWQDFRYAARVLRKSPGFTAVVVLTLTLAIGIDTAMFSIVQAVLLRPLPYKDSARLVAIWGRGVRETGMSKIFDSYRDYEAWKRDARGFEQMAAATWAVGGQILTGSGTARTILSIPVSADFFALLGRAPVVGRTFDLDVGKRGDLSRGDSGCSVVLDYGFWRSQFGARKDIAGKAIDLDDRACTVTGVMPPDFTFYPAAANMWKRITPSLHPEELPVGVFARLKAGVSIERAQAEVSAISRRLHSKDPGGIQSEPVVYPLQGEFTWLAGRNLRASLFVLLGAAGAVLLIACVNVASLLLGRSLARQREMAIRSALGSGRWRIIRQLLTEALLLSSAGAVCGFLLAALLVQWFRIANPVELPPGASVELNPQVLGFTAALAVLTALFFGVVPAWTASRFDLNAIMKTAGRGVSHGVARHALGKLFVIAQVTCSVALLAGAGLLIESVWRMARAPMGFRVDGLLTMPVSLPRTGYAQPERRTAFYARMLRDVSSLPGLDEAALATQLPPALGDSNVIAVEGRPAPTTATAVHDGAEVSISPDYFRVMDVPLLRGRVFREGDLSPGQPVAIVNESLAREYFPGEDPIGKRVWIGPDEKTRPWLTIIGVVADESHTTVYREMNWVRGATLFRAVAQSAPAALSLILSTPRAAPGIVAAVRSRIGAIDPAVPAGVIETMRARIDKPLAYPRFRAILLGAFAAMALLLAAVGIYGVLSQSVAQRTREIGVRMALGAEPRQVLRLVVSQGMALVVLGIALGIGAMLYLGPLLESLLYGVGAGDPTMLSLVSCVLLGAALVAVFAPARRAARVHPIEALREE